MTQRPNPDDDFLIVVDKPSGISSHTVVSRLRKKLHMKRIGHAGTLDPMATGILVCAVGRATKLLTYLVGLDKTYEATIRLGQSSDTDDADGALSETRDTSHLTDGQIETAIAGLRGGIDQVPSSVSAIKVNGRRAYDLARQGHEVTLTPRRVHIWEFTILASTVVDDGHTVVHDLDVRVRCSSGTYIRALARDVGAALGVGGHLTRLRRTDVGPFQITAAVDLDSDPDSWNRLSWEDVATTVFTTRSVTDDEYRELSFGRRIAASGTDDTVAAIGTNKNLVALLTDHDQHAKPLLVVRPA